MTHFSSSALYDKLKWTIFRKDYSMTQNKKSDVSLFQSTVLLSLFVILASQIQFSLFNTHFKISVGILCLPVFLYLLEDVPIIPISLLSGCGVSLVRYAIYQSTLSAGSGDFSEFYPEIFFYVVYGCLLGLYEKKHRPFFDAPLRIFPFILMDYSANVAEIACRNEVPLFTFHTQSSILLVAFLRSLLIVAVLFSFRRYHLVLLRAEHAERYKKLLLLYGKLSGEIEWMKKNITGIEESMNKSYALYHTLQEENHPQTRAALQVARDIHEIKKEYSVILLGLSEALDLNLSEDGMYMEEVLKILQSSMKELALKNGKDLVITSSFSNRLFTPHHYFYMSILRNLITNAIEASKSDTVHVTICGKASEDTLTLSVTDDGPGIPESDLSQIFEPGFSTKINYETGEISRGLGLGLVEELVRNSLHGEITVSSSPGNTTFTLIVPIQNWEAN